MYDKKAILPIVLKNTSFTMKEDFTFIVVVFMQHMNDC